MTNDQFKAWLDPLDLSMVKAAELLGVSTGTVELYKRGKRRDDGRDVVILKAVELACGALALGVRSYDGPQQAA